MNTPRDETLFDYIVFGGLLEESGFVNVPYCNVKVVFDDINNIVNPLRGNPSENNFKQEVQNARENARGSESFFIKFIEGLDIKSIENTYRTLKEKKVTFSNLPPWMAGGELRGNLPKLPWDDFENKFRFGQFFLKACFGEIDSALNRPYFSSGGMNLGLNPQTFMSIAENLYLKNKDFIKEKADRKTKMHDVLQNVKSSNIGHDFPPDLEALISDYAAEDFKRYSSRPVSDQFWENLLKYGEFVHKIRLEQEAALKKEEKEEKVDPTSKSMLTGYTSSSEKKHTTEEESRYKNKPS